MSVLSADSLSVRAADGSTLLSSVSLAVEPGESLLLCGPPGSGKTLLVKALAGLLADRTDLDVTGTVHRDGSVGFVFQNPAIQVVRRTVRRDVAFGLENRGVPVPEIEDRIDRHAADFDATALLDRRVESLSRGEIAKVALLGVLVTEPDVVMLDEPLASLDDRNSRLLLAALDRLRASETTIVVAEHDARDLLGRVDRTALVLDGRISSNGSPEAILEDLHRAGVKLPVGVEIAIEAGTVDGALVEDSPVTDAGVERR